jgi:hypothetical protein
VVARGTESDETIIVLIKINGIFASVTRCDGRNTIYGERLGSIPGIYFWISFWS